MPRIGALAVACFPFAVILSSSHAAAVRPASDAPPTTTAGPTPTQSSATGSATVQDAGTSAHSETRSLNPGEVQTEASRVYVLVGKTGLGHNHGVEGRMTSGILHLGATEDAGEFVFDLSTFDADGTRARRFVGLEGSTDASTRQEVNTNMQGPSVLDVQRYPTATYKIDSARSLDRKSRRGLPMYELNGKFTLHNHTRPLKIVVDVDSKDGMSHVRGNFNMLQTQFGITPFSKAFGAVGVADKLTVHGDLWVGEDTETATADTTRR